MMVSGTRRIVASLVGLAGGVGSFAVDGLYLVAIDQQGVTPPGGRVVFVALWIATAGLLAVSGAFMRRPSVGQPPCADGHRRSGIRLKHIQARWGGGGRPSREDPWLPRRLRLPAIAGDIVRRHHQH